MELVRKICIVLLILLPVLFIASIADGQIKPFKANATDKQKTESVIYKNFVNECDLMIAYTRENYWWHAKRYYSLLALNKGRWYRGYLFSEQLKSGKWTYPKIRFEEVDADSAMAMIGYLNKAGLYTLSQDSLNIDTKIVDEDKVRKFSVSDGVNYKFEILYKNELAIVEAYSPEYLLSKLPEIKTREAFIKCRDWFVRKYDELEPIGEYHLSY